MSKSILDIYSRYLKSLSDQNANIGENFAAMEGLLYQVVETDDLRGRLHADIVYQTLKAIIQRRLSCKQAAPYWDVDVVQQLYTRLNTLNQTLREGDNERAMVITTNMFKLIDQFQDDNPWLCLYMYLAYSRTFAGSWLTRHRERMADHQEIMQLLQEQCDNPAPPQTDPKLAIQTQIVESSKNVPQE